MGKLEHNSNCGVVNSSLDQADIIALHVSLMRKLFLGQSGVLTLLTKDLSESYADIHFYSPVSKTGHCR
jgi:hypothetical protein